MALLKTGPEPVSSSRLPFLKLEVGEKAVLQIADVREAVGLKFSDIILDVRKGKELLSLPVAFKSPNYTRLVEKFTSTFAKWARGKITVIGALEPKFNKTYIQIL